MKRKRDILTRQIKKWKARLNVDGSKMKQNIHYDKTYAPVASWMSVRTLLTLSAINNWHTRQIDYVLAFPQAPVEKELYMAIPSGIDVSEGDKKDYALKLHRNVYGQKQAGRVWYNYLRDKLIHKVGFTPSKYDDCVFYKGKTMYILYTDDPILAGPDKKEINKILQDIQKAGLNVTDEGDLKDFLGINIKRQEDGSILLQQPHLIDQILQSVALHDNKVKEKTTPAMSSKILRRHLDLPDFDQAFDYASVIGKLNYLERGTRPDIAYAVHQCARFSTNPKKEHGDAIRHLVKYLKGTKDKGLILRPNDSLGLEVYVDADFAGNWHKDEWQDRDTACSRHGYMVLYKGCMLSWKSQLQTEITLSTTESEYTGLSHALREVIPLMNLMNEMVSLGFVEAKVTPKMQCKVFEDNSGALEIAKEHKYRPRTKHLNIKLHHFRDYVDRGEITINKIDTCDQLTVYLTKPLERETLERLRKRSMGW